MIRLLFVVPYPELEEKVRYVMRQHPNRERLKADIRLATIENLPTDISGRYDAVIARGYSARKALSAYADVPVITLTFSGYDIIRAISECVTAYGSQKIAVCGFDRQLYEAGEIGQMLNTEVELYAPVRFEELPQIMEKAIAAGCDAVIGGYSANMIAQKYGLPAKVIKTGEDAILQAINQAIHTVDRIRSERITAQMYRTIIHTSKDAILYVDVAGRIQVSNAAAAQLTGNSGLQNTRLEDTLPYLQPIFHTVMTRGEEVMGKIRTIPGTKTIVSIRCTPVQVNKKRSGAIVNMTDITLIQDLESRIRRKLSEKGYQAKYTFEDIVHQSCTVDATIEQARRYAKSDSNVIIVGETGTGKELFAQSIHNDSRRKNGPFVAINCAALTENLLESELFGYVEGTFTGASKGGKMGLFEQANGGTLFLDEIGEISLTTQSKLLRVLQEKQVRRIGGDKVIDVDVRVISATNKSISKLAEQGKFRKDLVYRLDVLRLFVPPLREREKDVEMLFIHLLKEREDNCMTTLDPEAIPLLYQYPFYGNIRELKNITERTSVMRTGESITRDELYEALYPQDLEETTRAAEPEQFLPEEREEERLRQALEQCGGNRTKTAKMLGMDRSTLWRKLQKYGI